ncbi:MAG: DEAD/DEAH box helicase [Prevotella sp.]|nr:DEAD/DEAH box helicase [Prevotella sp.]
MKFEKLDLNDNILDALYDMRFEDCTPIQENCIPPILEKRDVLGVAQTGTGKTAAYLLPILSRLADGGFPKDAVNCIIMSPTRELAQQIDQAMQGFSYYLPDVSSVAVYGGNDGNRYDQEMKSMRLGADVIIATPGRLISHMSMGNIDLSKVSFFVLDEADRMLDMGFSEDIMKIASGLPESCQTIMFSATMPKDIETMAQKLLKNPVEIKLAVSKPAEKINQSAYICYETQKLKIIDDIFKAGDLKRVIIFSGSKMKVKQINQALQRLKINCGEMHSDLDQAQRDEMMYKFKSGQIDVLVATDIVARGIDIDDIAMVINYDVPHDAEDYVHRIGRTARADRDGVAITFVNEDDMYAFHQIEKFLEREITKNPLPEECGDGPEYTTSKRLGRTSAKSRRRNDRNQTSHRDAKQHEHGRRNNRNAHGNNGKSDGQNAANADRPQGNRQQQRRQSEGNRRPVGNTDSAQRDARTGNSANKRRSRNNRQGNTDDRRQEASRSNGTVSRNNGNRRNGSHRARQQGDYKKKRTAATSASTTPTTASSQHDSGITKLIKRPLRWLRSLGKK